MPLLGVQPRVHRISSHAEHLKQLGNDLEPTFLAGKNDGREVGVDRLEGNPGVAPRVTVLLLLALIPLYGLTLSEKEKRG